MKRFPTLLTILILVIPSCSGGTGYDSSYRISFPQGPRVMFDNEDAGKMLVNYFNIVQLEEGRYSMYYAAFENGSGLGEFDQNLYVAFSEDLVHWTFREEPVMTSICEQSVTYMAGKEYPFILVGNIYEDDRYKLCMWFSKDGLNFTDRKVVLEDCKHDSQSVIVPGKDCLKLYLRKTEGRLPDGSYDRRVGLCRLDMDGNPISDITLVSGHFLYNSAPSSIDNDTDLLLPTYYYDAGQQCNVKAYTVKGIYSHEIECPLNDWLEENEKWVIVAPGILTLDGNQYIAYNVRTTSHDDRSFDTSSYKLIRITFCPY